MSHVRPAKVTLWDVLALVALYVALGWCVYAEETHARRTQQRKEQLDLPVFAPRLGQKMKGFYPEGSTPPPTPEPEGDDPKDVPPPVFYGEEIYSESDSLIYVLDRSGSMGVGKSPSRWDKARSETQRSVSALASNMRFDVVVFGSTVLARFGELREASDANKSKAVAWLRALSPGGGTPTGPACALALAEDRTNRCLILLSDGAPSNGTGKARKEIRTANTQGAAINTFGVQAYGEFRAFLQGVAADSGGVYVDVP